MTALPPIKGAENLPSRWSLTQDLGGYDMPIRLEGEIGDVMVRGTIPDSIDGTFYRVGSDHFTLLFLATNDWYKLERNMKRSVWGDMRDHPVSQHPCVKAVLTSTSNTNVIYWAGRLLALQEMDPPYAMDPDTLETTGVDPFGNQILSPTFTAHPKIDSNVDELVTWGIDHGTNEIISYSIDRHENWIVFCQWPTSFVDGTTAWDTSRPAVFVVAPRHPEHPLEGSGWEPYEHRMYTHFFNSEIVHTAGAWEEGSKIFFEGIWPHDSLFPFWPKTDGKKPSEKTVVDLVRLEIDISQPSNTKVPDPVTLVDIPNEFPRIDERFYCRKYDHIFTNIYHSKTEKYLMNKHVFEGLNATAMLIKSTGQLKVYYPGPNCRCQEPVFIPRSDNAPEGDGHVIFAVDRLDINLTNLVILDTKDFEHPVAVIELPLRMRAQIHGNWVDARELNGQPLVVPPPLHHMTWRHRPGQLAPTETRCRC
ncbi:unnamed protein product [Aspergillus udagawae]|nr:unnamed protein product [Aspergillus udagawae]